MLKLRKLIITVGAAVLGISLAANAALAQENLWKNVQEAGVLKVGGAEATPY
jgi:hypothetical protein